MSVPDLGFGIIIKKKVSGADKYRAVFFHKIKFNIPEDAATTQGETIEWQTPTIEGVIMRDDSTKHAWKSEATLDTEADAVTSSRSWVLSHEYDRNSRHLAQLFHQGRKTDLGPLWPDNIGIYRETVEWTRFWLRRADQQGAR